MRTIDLVLNISEVEAGAYKIQQEQLDLEKDIINSILLESAPLAESKGLSLKYINKAEGEIILNIDRYTISQILINLVNNAIKYTHSGFVHIVVSEEENKIIVKIIDTGIGISKEYLPYLFVRFSQEEGGYTRKFEGNGLGLALVKKYCDLNNTEIFCSSRKGEGTTFTLVILK